MKRIKTMVAAAGAALVLAGCATPPPIAKPTASGKPEVLLKGWTVQAAKARLLERCAMRGMQVEEQQSTVACTRTLNDDSGALAQMLLGNARSTTPVQRSVFLVTQRGADAFVMLTTSTVSTQMPGGQVNSQEIKTNHLINTVQEFLDSLSS